MTTSEKTIRTLSPGINGEIFKDKKVLVTGGTGLVGRELTNLLYSFGAKVHVVSLDYNNLDNPDIIFRRDDLRDFQTCRKVCHGMDYVFHVAGIKGSPVVAKSKQYTFFTNFQQMNTNMIAAMYESSMKWGVYCSTVGTYGPAEVFKEDLLWAQMPSPNDWYAGWAKRMGEVQIDAYEKQSGHQRISIIRPVNICGQWDNFNLETSTLVPSLVRKVAEAEGSVPVWGNGSAARDIIHAFDVAQALVMMVEQRITQPLNVGNGKGITIREVIETLVKVSGKDLKIEWDISKPTGDKLRIADTTKLQGYGFTSSIPLEDGLKDTYDWYCNNKENTGNRYDPFIEKDHANMWG